eukprot:497255_1
MAVLQDIYAIPGFEIYVAVIAIVIYFAFMIYKEKKESSNGRVSKPMYAFILLTAVIGIGGALDVIYGIIEIIASKASAQSLDREASPYQLQLAFAQIGTGIVGFSTLAKPSFMVPAMITKISMSFGMGYSIIVEFIQSGATPDSKMAMTLFWSLFVPVVILVLFGVIELLKIKGKAQDLKEKVGGGVEKESLVQHVPDESVDAGNGSDANP